MLEFLGELVLDGCELGDGEGGEVDWEEVFISMICLRFGE